MQLFTVLAIGFGCCINRGLLASGRAILTLVPVVFSKCSGDNRLSHGARISYIILFPFTYDIIIIRL